MRILSFGNCPLDPRFGSGKTRLAWSEGLRACGHTVETRDAPALLTPFARRLGFRLGLAWAGRRDVGALDLSRYDVVEFYGAEFWWATDWLSRRAPRPLILAHTDGLELLAGDRLAAAGLVSRGRLERWFPMFDLAKRSRRAFTRADRFIALCRRDIEYAIQHGLLAASRMALVPPGLDTVFLGRSWTDARDNVVVFFGSSAERKGVHHLGAVANRFLAEHPDWRLLILGAAGQGEAFRAVMASEIWPRVEVAPHLSVEAVIQRLERAKILFSPSEYEGFGLAVAETMACGCAAVVTPTGYAAELLDGTEAIVCEFGDRAAMLRALTALADDDTRRACLAQAGQQRVQELSWAKSVPKYERILATWVAEWTDAASRGSREDRVG